MADDEKVDAETVDESDDTGTDDAAGDAGTDKDEKDYKSELRRYERRSKGLIAAKDKELDTLKKRLKAVEDADKSEQDKALDEARQKARDEVLSQIEKERRAERLETAVIRQGAKSFADPEDALVIIERQYAKGDHPDLFDDDGQINANVLKGALKELLEAKPHLAAGEPDTRAVKGDADSGRGEKSDSKLDEMTPEDHARAMYSHK